MTGKQTMTVTEEARAEIKLLASKQKVLNTAEIWAELKHLNYRDVVAVCYGLEDSSPEAIRQFLHSEDPRLKGIQDSNKGPKTDPKVVKALGDLGILCRRYEIRLAKRN